MTGKQLPEGLRYKPVVAFDVDGVLRVHSSKLSEEERVLISVTMREDSYPDVYHGKPQWGPSGDYTALESFSKVAVNFLRSLQQNNDVDTVWATTWQRWANEYFVTPLGLAPLPVAVKTLAPFELNYAHCSPAWKSQQLSRQFDGRPLLWLDDNLPDRKGELLEELRRPEDRHRTLTYRVNPETGITIQDVLLIEEWLKLASTLEGQEELQRIELERLERARLSKEELALRRALEAELQRETLAKAKALFPTERYLSENLASLSQHRDGLTVETIEYALQRHGVQADAHSVGEALRREGYHYRDLDEVPL